MKHIILEILAALTVFTPTASALPIDTAGLPHVHYSQIKPLEAVKMAPIAKLDTAPFPYLPIGTRANSYAPANCTWGAASMKPTVPNNWGNANQWDDHARAEGKTVSTVPIVGTVGIENDGYYGHAVVVVGVGAGTVTVEEMNYDWNGGVRTFTYPTSKFVYIYI